MHRRRHHPPAQLQSLVEELLEANLDTVELALGQASADAWRRHSDYLQCLQREASATLARLSAPRRDGRRWRAMCRYDA